MIGFIVWIVCGVIGTVLVIGNATRYQKTLDGEDIFKGCCCIALGPTSLVIGIVITIWTWVSTHLPISNPFYRGE